MESIFSNNSPEILLAIGINFFLIIILFLMNISTKSKLKKLRNKYNKFMNGISSNNNIEGMLGEYTAKVHEVANKNKEIENHINKIERTLMTCIQKVGIIRFNAFDNVGSDLSFAIALLDDSDNGVVLCGIYSRDSSSTYAKPIAGGKSKYPLSAEEIQALDIAKKIYRERPL
jgi:hypothetical protein